MKIRLRNTNRGTISAAEIITAYQEAFGLPWWRIAVDMVLRLLHLGGVFQLADATYQEADEALIKQILDEDKTNLEKYIAEDFDCEVPKETAYALGLFFADGSCGLREDKYAGAWWRIVGWKKTCLERAQTALGKQYPNMLFPLRLYDSYKAGYIVSSSPFKDKERKKTLYCLEVAPKERHNDSSRGEFIEGFRVTNYDQYSNKKVPAGILESPSISKKAFLEGVFDGDGTPVKRSRNGGRITCHGIRQTAGLMDLMLDCGWRFNSGRDNGNENYYIIFNRKHEQLSPIPACDDFSFRLMGVFHQNPKTAAMPIFLTCVMTSQGGHAVLSYYYKGKVNIIEPQRDWIYNVPTDWTLMLMFG